MSHTNYAPSYFAVPDPDQPDVMTYWRRNAKGHLVAHPLRAPYGPMLYSRGEHEHIVPPGLTGQARRNWIGHWYRTFRYEWLDKVHAAIAVDEPAAALRFSAFCARCCICGRLLTDASSKTYGIGPECRAGLPDEMLAALVCAVGSAHAQMETTP